MCNWQIKFDENSIICKICQTLVPPIFVVYGILELQIYNQALSRHNTTCLDKLPGMYTITRQMFNIRGQV